MIPCPKCGGTFRLKDYLGKNTIRCKSCNTEVNVNIFPSLFQPIKKGQSAEKVVEELESSCFNHVEKKAVSICDDCGIYICALCEIDRGEKKICSACFNQSLVGEKADELTRDYRQYSKIGAYLLWGMLFTYGITAPISLFYSIKNYGKTEGFFRGRKNLKASINIIIASLFSLGGLIGILYLILGNNE